MVRTMKLVAGCAFGIVVLSLAACSAGETPSTSAGGGSTQVAAPAPAAGADDGVTTPAQVFGPACGQLPQGDAPGGLEAMGPQPVATAASTNPLLGKLVAAVEAVPGLADTLNNTDNLTVFAPADPAFEALGDATFAELAANPTALSPILQFHVVAKRYDRAGLESAGTLNSLNTAAPALRIEGGGDAVTVNGATVLCGNIPTKNATVFVIDKVLVPTS